MNDDPSNLPSPPHGVRACPFCGGPAYASEDPAPKVGCSARCAVMPRVMSSTIDEAIAAWNRRAYDQRIAELTKERDEAVAKFSKLWREHGAELAEALGAAVGQEHLRIEAESRSTRAEGLLGEAVEVLEPFARMGDLIERYGEFRKAAVNTGWGQHFRAAAALLTLLRQGEGQ